jgi:mono/diheme cytochrome c family protein
MSTRSLALAAKGFAALLLIGCGSGQIDGPAPPPTKTVSRELETLTVREVAWNAAKVDVGTVSAIAEDDEELVLFGQKGATMMAGGAVRVVIPGATSWTAAATIPAADGVGDWIVGAADMGRLFRVRAESSLEDISERYGLGTDKVRSIVGIDAKSTAFGFEGGIAIADGATVTRYAGPQNGMLAGGSGRLAWIDPGKVSVLTLSDRKVRSFSLSEAKGVAIDAAGRVVVTAGSKLWIETDGVLTLRWTADAPIGSIATAGPRVWMTVGSELAVATGDALSKSSGANVANDARLSGTPSGDLWIVSTTGVRKVSGSAPSEAIADWEATIKPIYAKVCSECHAPGGSAGSDLSTYDGWLQRKDRVHQRVIVDRTMPPKGKAFTETDYAAIRDWLTRAGK